MKRSVLIACAILSCAGSASAQYYGNYRPPVVYAQPYYNQPYAGSTPNFSGNVQQFVIPQYRPPIQYNQQYYPQYNIQPYAGATPMYPNSVQPYYQQPQQQGWWQPRYYYR